MTQLDNPFNQVALDSFVNHSTPQYSLKITKVALSGDFNGVFIYRVNRLVQVLKVMTTVQMGKRTFKEANLSVSAIVSVFKNADTSLDKTVSQQLNRISNALIGLLVESDCEANQTACTVKKTTGMNI